MKKENICINILTRTSGRPIGFFNCRQSVIKQKYKNIVQHVSYEEEIDLSYLNTHGINPVKVEKYKGVKLINPEGHLHAPYNLYCNTLLDQVTEGWVLFLDDDDHLRHNKVIKELVSEIKKFDEDTLFIWQMRYPNGKLLPTSSHFKSKHVEFEHIGSPCFLFHSKYKKIAKWDHWKASDYRVVKRLDDTIPNKIWLERPYIQINNYGDFGRGNDIIEDVTNHIIFKKTWYWYAIPKYHTTLKGVYVFQINTYKCYWRRIVKKLKRMFNIKR
jgi:hypothetical protein